MDKNNSQASGSKSKIILDIIAYLALCWLLVEKGVIPWFEHRIEVQMIQDIERTEIGISSLTPDFFNNLVSQAEFKKNVLQDQSGLAKNLPAGYGNYELHIALQKKDSAYSVYATCHVFCECGCTDDTTKFGLIVVPLDIRENDVHDDKFPILTSAVTTWQNYLQQAEFALKGGVLENNSSVNASH